MPAINEQSLLSFEIGEMPEVVVHVTKQQNSTVRPVSSSFLSVMILLSFMSSHSGLHTSSQKYLYYNIKAAKLIKCLFHSQCSSAAPG